MTSRVFWALSLAAIALLVAFTVIPLVVLLIRAGATSSEGASLGALWSSPTAGRSRSRRVRT